MSNALTTKRESPMPALSMGEDELIGVLQNSLYPGASNGSVKMVLGYCKAAGLDPMQKPVHIVPIWDKKTGNMIDVVMPGIGLYRTQAARSGVFAGISEPEFGPDVTENIGGMEMTYPLWCRVIARRELPSGKIVDFASVERWKENYAVRNNKEKSIAPNSMWQKRPYAQLAKCAQAQSLRLAFPELGSAPTADEMEGKELENDITPVKAIASGSSTEEKPPYPQDRFEKSLSTWKEMIESGKKTADDIIKTVQTKAVMTETQIAKINEFKKATPTVIEGEFMTEAEVAAARQREIAEGATA